MKIGILTFHKAKNYGAVLQTFALQRTLKSLGVDAYIINRYSGYKTLIHQIYFTFHPSFIFQRSLWILFDHFSRKYLVPQTKKYKTNKSLKNFEKNENLDVVVVGSDQVWRMEFSNIGYNYFFDFIKGNDIRKISYAASFGKDKWNESEEVTIHVKQLLKDFNSISVREKSGVNICSEIFNIKATQVLDPTLLLKKEDYDSILLKNYPVRLNNTIVSYILGNNQESLRYCNSFAKNNDLDFHDLYCIYPINKIFSTSDYGKMRLLHITVPKWLDEIRNAKYVITNSFHATVFSILFSKQFIVVDHTSGGTDRITSLLESLGLQDRFVLNITDISLMLFQEKIDYDSVNLKLETERTRSILFLRQSLSL